jgi:hypothetical protein
MKSPSFFDRHPKLLWFLLSIPVAILFAAVAYGGTVEVRKSTATEHDRGEVISALGLDANKWTGWIATNDMRSVVFDITFTDANSSVTAVTMVCESSASSATANDGGFDLHTVSVAAGTITSSVAQWTYTTSGSKNWTWTVSNVPGDWLNCEFAATGTPASIDTVTVVARGVTP